MRRHVVISATTLLMAACVEDPIRPELDSLEELDPAFAVYVARSDGTIELKPLHEGDLVLIQGINRSGQAVGRSGDVPVLWTLSGPADDPVVVREITELTGVLEIDASGRILGHRDDRAAILRSGTVTLIQPLPGHDKTAPGGISGGGGYVVGTSWTGDPEETSRGFRWLNGSITGLRPLSGHESAQALAVNRYGTAAGVSYDAQTELRTIVVWKGTTPVSTGFLQPGHLMLGISDAGDVLISSDEGDEVVLWRDGVARRLPRPDGSRPFFGLDISPGGRVLGKVESASGAERYGVWRGSDFFRVSASPVTSCWRVSDGGHVVCDSPMRTYPFYTFVSSERLRSRAVKDLTPTSASETTITVRWTQVPDDRGNPARYRVKYSRPPLSWSSATIGCDRRGTEVGAPLSCTVSGLDPSTSYDFQLMSFRVSDGSWVGAVYSNIGVGETEP